MRTLQKFAAVLASVHNNFPTERYLQDRNPYKLTRAAALAEWRGLFAARREGEAVVTETGSHLSDSTLAAVGRPIGQVPKVFLSTVALAATDMFWL